MIIFKFDYNFDPVKEILKIKCQIYIWMKKVTSLWATILQPFQFELEHKKTCGNESHEKETKHNHASAADLLHIRIGSLD